MLDFSDTRYYNIGVPKHQELDGKSSKRLTILQLVNVSIFQDPLSPPV